jgi:hypothetical protein
VPADGAQGAAGETDAATDAPSGLSPAAAWLNERSALYRFAAPALAQGAPALAKALAQAGLIERSLLRADTPADYIPVAYGVYRQPLGEEWRASVELTGALLAELRVEAEHLGAPLVAVLVTAPEQVYPDRWQQRLDGNPAMAAHTWDLEQPSRLAADLFQATGIPYLDLLPRFRSSAAAGEPLHLRHDGHWTPAGERLAGETLAEFLQAQRLVPGG